MSFITVGLNFASIIAQSATDNVSCASLETVAVIPLQPAGNVPLGDISNDSDDVTIIITPSRAVTVTGGIPTLTLSDGATATYDPVASTPTLLIFRHIVQTGQDTPGLAIAATNLNGAAITDAAGNPVDITPPQRAAALSPPTRLVFRHKLQPGQDLPGLHRRVPQSRRQHPGRRWLSSTKAAPQSKTFRQPQQAHRI